MKKRKFLRPFSASVTALLVALPTSALAVSEPIAKYVAEAKNISSETIVTKPFVLGRSGADAMQGAYHTSHYSHQSHSSHSSHSSHQSHSSHYSSWPR